MKNKKIIIMAAALIAIAAVAAGIHLTTRDEVTAGCVELIYNGKSHDIAISDMKKDDVSGIRVNGKGEEIEVSGKGISLADLLAMKKIEDFTKVTVVSDDSYSAEVSKDEVMESGKAYMMVEGEEARLVVFGDTNSKRSVSNVKQIVVE
ncbi:MAG: hypothetical protein E7432_08560 [Ruminococcaceae bacterium]|nr:hypothetical protein [Oscillospiraceae bacterium]